jgi:dual 3',5'-cyclic-AMP and -GMP phosphodiesterase 11
MTAETAPSTVAPPGGEAGSKYQYYDPEYARMEAWLDEHPDFVQDYFLRCDISGIIHGAWDFKVSSH